MAVEKGLIGSSMVQKSQAIALVPGLIILCLMLDNSNANLCSSTFEASLLQTKQLIMHIDDVTKQLYESYLLHHDLDSTAVHVCKRNISWFPKRDITKNTVRMLHRLHRTLQHMNNALTVIREQQRNLNLEDAPLHKELKKAQNFVKGLLHNTKCTLSRKGQTPTSIPPVTISMDRTTFEQKIDGCQVLWNYSQFISNLTKAFKSAAQKER